MSVELRTQCVHVNLAGRSYDIKIGRGEAYSALQEIKKLAPKSRMMIVTDETVLKIHNATVVAIFGIENVETYCYVVPPGEASKSWTQLGVVVEHIIEKKFERGDIIIAFGGGVIGDLTGFAASMVRRGVRFVQIPTTLLAQVDSSVGGKTGINSPQGKNLIGAFYQPILVLADTALLDTLPIREMRAGYAEVVKYGLIDKPEFFDWLEAGAWKGIFSGGPEREEAVRISCEAKAAIVARDETETGDRALLNLGHTFGHALEQAVNYDSKRLVHGEGVAIGMSLAHRFSHKLGLISGQDVTRVTKHLDDVGLPTRLQQIKGGVGTADSLLQAMYQDKKVTRGKLNFILTKGIGKSFIARDIEPSSVIEFLKHELRAD
jgi:3-dehydroquinate synthase